MSYWAQFTASELIESHGISFYNYVMNTHTDDCYQESKECNNEEFYCNRCRDAGCYMCNLE
jgi:hypothetical protein